MFDEAIRILEKADLLFSEDNDGTITCDDPKKVMNLITDALEEIKEGEKS